MIARAEIVHVPASAGSGKTYQLSRRYLEKAGNLVSRSGTGKPVRVAMGCRMSSTVPGLEGLLAITFTNKAAAEMKDRILLFLKQLAFGDDSLDAKNFQPLDDETLALSLLIEVVRDFSRFHVKTIDSFMTTLLKAFSADIGLLPDFRLLLSEDELYDLAVSDLFEYGKSSHIDCLLDVMLREVKSASRSRSDGKGFDPERIVRRALKRLRGIRDRELVKRITETRPGDTAADRKQLSVDVAAFIDRLQERADGALNRNRVRSDHAQKARKGIFPNWITDGSSLESLAKKNAVIPGVSELQNELDALRIRIRDLVLREAVERLRSGVLAYRAVMEREEELGRLLKCFHIGRMTDTIRRVLKEKGAPLAFCRMGERYVHYLIDEFQDTSRDQWNALAPLLENSLSSGGSLFLVGDRKQAIYGWRGGDYRLFDEVLLRPGDPKRPDDIDPVTGPVDSSSIRREPLGSNRRSAKNIVEFNNRLFEGLKEGKVPLTVGRDVLRGVYQDVHQETHRSEEGYLSIRALPAGKRQEILPAVRDWLENVLRPGGSPRFRPEDVLILARRKEEVRTIAAWLTEWDLPFVTEDSLRLFSQPVVKALVNLMSAMTLADADHYLAAVVSGGWLGRLDAGMGEAIVSDWSRLSREKERAGNVSPPLWEWLATDGPAPVQQLMSEVAGVSKLGSAYEQLAELVRVLQLDHGPERVFVEQLLEVVLGLEDDGVVDPGDVLEVLYRQLGGLSLTLPETPGSVRIMTIHKAKGLEAPVVILPFVDWGLVHRDPAIVPYRLAGQDCVIQVNKDVAAVDETLAAALARERERETVESVNLLYVAMTRPRDALYIACPDPESRSHEPVHVGDVFLALLEEAGFKLPPGGELVLGTPPAGRQVKEPDRSETPVPRRRPVDLLVVQDRPEIPLDEASARFRGTLLHRAMQEIRVLPEGCELAPVVQVALRRACAALGVAWSRELETNEAPRLIAVLKQLEPWFRSPARAWNEKEIVGSKGAIIRIDRLVIRDGTPAIIDYKTGRPDPTHRDQVQRYRRILGNTFREARMILAYLDSGEVVHVR